MKRNVEIIGVNRIAYNAYSYDGQIRRRKVLLMKREMDYLKELLASNDADKEYKIDAFCYTL